MLIIGAKGFAKELLEVCHQLGETKQLAFYDDVSTDLPDKLYGKFEILSSETASKVYFKNTDNRFALGLGNPALRKKMTEQFTNWGGELTSLISPKASIGHFNNNISLGVCIMTGTVITNDVKIAEGVLLNLNCTVGHDGPEKYHGLGINGKMSELNAAMGLAVFPYLQQINVERKLICYYYDDNLGFRKLSEIKLRTETDWNYAYYPVIFKSEKQLLEIKGKLENEGIFPRRYFYPSLEDLPYVSSKNYPIAEDIAERVLCLPLYVGLEDEKIKTIINLIIDN